MSDDLVKRLRKLVDTEDMHPLSIFAETIRGAADYIEHQHASHEAMVEEIERLTRELEQERKNCLRVGYERDEAIREIGAGGRKRGHAEAERDAAYDLLKIRTDDLHAAISRAEAAERKVEKLREALRKIERCYGPEPWQLTRTMKETARAALAETENGNG